MYKLIAVLRVIACWISSNFFFFLNLCKENQVVK